jgi:hypothetical protein
MNSDREENRIMGQDTGDIYLFTPLKIRLKIQGLRVANTRHDLLNGVRNGMQKTQMTTLGRYVHW